MQRSMPRADRRIASNLHRMFDGTFARIFDGYCFQMRLSSMRVVEQIHHHDIISLWAHGCMGGCMPHARARARVRALDACTRALGALGALGACVGA